MDEYTEAPLTFRCLFHLLAWDLKVFFLVWRLGAYTVYPTPAGSPHRWGGSPGELKTKFPLKSWKQILNKKIKNISEVFNQTSSKNFFQNHIKSFQKKSLQTKFSKSLFFQNMFQHFSKKNTSNVKKQLKQKNSF